MECTILPLSGSEANLRTWAALQLLYKTHDKCMKRFGKMPTLFGPFKATKHIENEEMCLQNRLFTFLVWSFLPALIYKFGNSDVY
jgi:hypothetical protein